MPVSTQSRPLAARSCYVCGDGPHAPSSHTYWSNSEAAREFESIPAPVGRAPETAYVASYGR